MAGAFSILILTLNEERNLAGCLDSVRGCADVVVLDSGSTDRTPEIARAAGARLFQRSFDTFAGQRNHAQKEIPFRHPWIFHLDADERMTAALASECSRQSGRQDLDGFYAAPRMLFRGRWIPHCTDFPAWQARFVRAPRFTFIDAGHGQREAPGLKLDRLRASYLHEILPPGGEAEWLEKHRRYARAEAAAESPSAAGSAGSFFSADALQRRRALKAAARHLPCRGPARFLYQYVLRRGFLDGRAGLRYCLLLARYEGFIVAEKRQLLRARAAGRS